MEHDFWLNAWENNRTGWRQNEPGDLLVRNWPSLGIPPGSTVLVPLCGDTPDMQWLINQGYQVVGCDLSESSLLRFAKANELSVKRSEHNGMALLSAPGIRLYAGDFMTLTPQLAGPIHAFFDRAATIALPPQMRDAYAQQIASLVPTAAVGLLISIEYNQNEMKGPPFSVPPASIQDLYAGAFSIQVLETNAGSAFAGNLKERGVTHLTETAYRLYRQA